MNNKIVPFLLLIIVSAGILFFSASQYRENIRSLSKVETPATVENAEEITEKSQSLSAEDIQALGASLDETTRNILLARAAEGEQVQMLLLGSTSFGLVAEHVTPVIENTYQGLIEIDYAGFDMTSAQFVEEGLLGGLIDWEKGYDIVLYEPFTLNNNGIVTVEDEQADILMVQAHTRDYVSDAAFLISPPQPIYGARFYLTQITALEQYTTDARIPYINHWVNWPDHQTEEILPYLDDNSLPTELGIETWSDALVDYFIFKG